MAIEVQVGWWCGGASGTFVLESLDHPCTLTDRLPVYVKVEPVGGVSDTDTSCAPDRPATDHNVAKTAAPVEEFDATTG